jgi:hypothetical protein
VRRRPRSGAALLGSLAAIGLLSACPGPAEGETVAPGASRQGDVVSLGRDLDVEGDVGGSVVATGAHVTISGRVGRHVVVLGGGATVRGRARIDGDLLVLGGSVSFEDGASAERSVGGRVRSVEALEAAFLTELRTSPVRNAALSPLLVSFRLLLLFVWLAAGLLLLRLFPRTLLESSARLPGRTVLLGAVGAAAVLAALLLSAFLLLVLPARAALAATAALVSALFVLKAWGLSAVFVALGTRLLRRSTRGGLLFGAPAAIAAGLVALGLPSLLPMAGPVVWGVASLVGIGLSLQSLAGGERAAVLDRGWPAAA